MRGAAMQEAVPVGLGAMAAVLKGDSARIVAICEQVSQELQKAVDGILQPHIKALLDGLPIVKIFTTPKNGLRSF